LKASRGEGSEKEEGFSQGLEAEAEAEAEEQTLLQPRTVSNGAEEINPPLTHSWCVSANSSAAVGLNPVESNPQLRRRPAA
jgi:hypothetical protein